MNKKMKQVRSSREWLKKMADAEERYVSVTVGGLASDFGMLPSTAQVRLPVFSQFIEFARRKMNMSIEEFADEADIDLDELLAVAGPQQKDVFRLQVPVHDSPVVGGREGPADLDGDANRARRIDDAVANEFVCEVIALEEFHGQEEAAVVELAEVEHIEHIGMLDA